jgi:hypothetical protein
MIESASFARVLRALALISVAALHAAGAASAQEPIPSRVRVFIECNGDACDTDHLRSQIVYVDWVRDRMDGDVQILVTEESTGAGGERYDLAFAGRGAFEGVSDTLRYTRNPTDTDGEARDGMTRTVAAGLVRYAARTQALRGIEIDFDEDADVREVSSEDDPWNRWVFRTSIGGSVAAEDRANEFSFRGDQSIGRVTEGSKLALNLAWRHDESNFDTSDTTTITSITRSFRTDGLVVWSLGSHWGVGARGSVERSTFRNYDLALRLTPAIEFNVFPYEESTRRQLRILGAVGPEWYDYTEETIYLKTGERRLRSALSVSLDVTEPWGEALVAVEGATYLDRLHQSRIEGYGFFEFQVVRGLGLFVEGSVARVRDQLNLPRGDATPEEVLLRQRELKTDFELGGRIGVNFTFGSVFSDVVNSRFGG